MTKQAQRGWLVALALTLVALALGLILFALEEKITFYKTPKEITGTKFLGQYLRIGGFVKKDSVKQRGAVIYFTITDFEEKIHITYEGVLPDLFREEQGVIVQGVLKSKRNLVADKIFAKHDENYRPPNLEEIKK